MASVKICFIILMFFAGIASIFEVVLADTNAPPADILDLQAVNVGSDRIQFSWTAPGADGMVEPATSYDFRQGNSVFTSANWNSQTKINGLPTPGQPGTQETFTLTGLSSDTAYYFAVRGVDSLGVLSQIFNMMATTTLSSGNSGVTNVVFRPKLDGIALSSGRSFTITFYAPNTVNQVYQFSGTADSGGALSLPANANLNAGNYDILT